MKEKDNDKRLIPCWKCGKRIPIGEAYAVYTKSGEIMIMCKECAEKEHQKH